MLQGIIKQQVFINLYVQTCPQEVFHRKLTVAILQGFPRWGGSRVVGTSDALVLASIVRVP